MKYLISITAFWLYISLTTFLFAQSDSVSNSLFINSGGRAKPYIFLMANNLNVICQKYLPMTWVQFLQKVIRLMLEEFIQTDRIHP